VSPDCAPAPPPRDPGAASGGAGTHWPLSAAAPGPARRQLQEVLQRPGQLRLEPRGNPPPERVQDPFVVPDLLAWAGVEGLQVRGTVDPQVCDQSAQVVALVAGGHEQAALALAGQGGQVGLLALPPGPLATRRLARARVGAVQDNLEDVLAEDLADPALAPPPFPGVLGVLERVVQKRPPPAPHCLRARARGRPPGAGGSRGGRASLAGLGSVPRARERQRLLELPAVLVCQGHGRVLRL